MGVGNAGPGVGGNYGPYRQSERNSLYKHYAEKLLQSGHVYRCFCSNEVLFYRHKIGFVLFSYLNCHGLEFYPRHPKLSIIF